MVVYMLWEHTVRVRFSALRHRPAEALAKADKIKILQSTKKGVFALNKEILSTKKPCSPIIPA